MVKKTSNFFDSFEDYNLNIHGVRLPEFKIEGNDLSNPDFLKKLCYDALKEKGLSSKDSYSERVKYELETIEELGFVDYILLVWDVINYCRTNNIPVGMGRGSAAGSLVLFLIEVTQIDPLKHGLFFERFISKTRAKKKVVDGVTYLDGSLMADIDLDICYYNRPKVLAYLEHKFEGKTCKILTLNSLQGKLLIKECGKIISDYSEDEVKKVANLIPEMFGKVKDIEKAYEEEKSFKDWCDANGKVYQTALRLRNLIKNKSVHASAMMLSHGLLDDSCPTEISSSKEVVSSFDMNWSSLNNVKLDLLGLRAVSVVEDVCKNVNIKLSDIDFEDSFIYQQLQDLKTPHGLFQLEADTVFKSCKKIKPKSLDELSGVMAVARPGAMQFVDDYALYTNTKTSNSIHPFFDDILGNTGGIALYQEQLMKMVHKIGFTLEEAETVRRIVGKKKVEEVKAWQEKIKNKIKENNLDPNISDILWRILDDSSNYSFNRSHSISYASLCAATIYLKFKYPKEFFLSLLKMTKHEPDPIEEISKIHKELDYFGIKLLRPDIIKSDLDFKIEGSNIRFGLSSVKGISDKTIEKLTKFRHQFSTKFDIFKAAEEAGLPINVLSALFQAGTLEDYSTKRSRIVLEAQLWNVLTDKEKKAADMVGKDNNYDLFAVLNVLSSKMDEKNKPVIRESRMATIKKKYAPYKEIYLINKNNEKFANWYYEKKLLGYSPEIQLKEIFAHKVPGLRTMREILEGDDNDNVTVIGFVKDAYSGISRKKTKYYKMDLADETASMPVFLFQTAGRDKIENCKNDNNGKLPKEDSIIIVHGVRKGDAIFANDVGIQDLKIYTKFGELKRDLKELTTEENEVKS